MLKGGKLETMYSTDRYVIVSRKAENTYEVVNVESGKKYIRNAKYIRKSVFVNRPSVDVDLDESVPNFRYAHTNVQEEVLQDPVTVEVDSLLNKNKDQTVQVPENATRTQTVQVPENATRHNLEPVVHKSQMDNKNPVSTRSGRVVKPNSKYYDYSR